MLIIRIFFHLQTMAQSPCASCTVNITSNNSSNYSLSAGQNMCISNGAIFRERLAVFLPLQKFV
jgi:hypothetical protein